MVFYFGRNLFMMLRNLQRRWCLICFFLRRCSPPNPSIVQVRRCSPPNPSMQSLWRFVDFSSKSVHAITVKARILTIDVEFGARMVTVEGHPIKFQVWDTVRFYLFRLARSSETFCRLGLCWLRTDVVKMINCHNPIRFWQISVFFFETQNRFQLFMFGFCGF